MIKFKPKKIGQKFTYKNHLLITEENTSSWQCYACAIKSLRKVKGDCATIHKCRGIHFRDLGKLERK